MVSSFFRLLFLVIFALLAALPSVQAAPSIINIEASSSTQGPGADISLITSSFPPNVFSLHNPYSSAQHLDIYPQYVIFTFDQPVEVTGLTMIQHANGITQLNVSAGESLGSLTSTATATSSFIDVPQGYAVIQPDGVSDTFTFSNPTVGTIQKFDIAKLSYDSGYASYRWYLDFQAAPAAAPTPEPASMALLGTGLALFAGRKLRKKA